MQTTLIVGRKENSFRGGPTEGTAHGLAQGRAPTRCSELGSRWPHPQTRPAVGSSSHSVFLTERLAQLPGAEPNDTDSEDALGRGLCSCDLGFSR